MAKSKLFDAHGQPLQLADLEPEGQNHGLAVFEKAEDKVIEAELRGRMDLSRYFIYAFETKAGTVIGLGVNGADFLFRKYHGEKGPKVAPSFPQINDVESFDDKKGSQTGEPGGPVRHVSVITKLISQHTDEEAVGLFRQCRTAYKSGYRKDGTKWEEWYPDLYADQKALNKAERNAKIKMVDPRRRLDWMFRWYREKKALDVTNISKLITSTAQQDKEIENASQSRAVIISSFFAIADSQGMETKMARDRDAVIAWIEGRMGKRISAMGDHELLLAKDTLDDAFAKNREKAVAEIRQAGIKKLPGKKA